MRRLVVLLVAFLVLGVVLSKPPVGAVPLLTGVGSCYAGGESGTTGRLLADADYGTRWNDRPVMWPTGFSGLRIGNEVRVLDATGRVVATTGRVYYISFGAVSLDVQKLVDRIDAYPAAANCPYPWDFVDCGTELPAVAPSGGRYSC